MLTDTEPLRLVHYLRRVRLEDGGVPRAVLDLCGTLAAGGHDVTLLTEDAADVPAEWQGPATGTPRVVTLAKSGLFAAAPPEIDAVFRAADVLHLHTPWEVRNLTLARWARRAGMPYVVSPHGMLDDWSMRAKALKKRLFLALVGRCFLAGAARIHCTADAELAQAARFLRPGSGQVVPLPLDLAPYADLPGLEPALESFPQLNAPWPRVLYLSRLHPKKRPDLLIEATGRLRKAGQPCQLVLAGPGDDVYVAQLEALVRRHGLERHVVFTGMVRARTKVALYQAATVFALPSSQENFGYVLLEALAAGTPIVTTPGVDIWEELQDAGATIVPAEVGKFVDALRPLLADPALAHARGQQGRAWVFERFRADALAGEYERFYLEARGARSCLR